MAETCHYNSSYSYFIARLGWGIDGCAKCSPVNHTAQLTTRNLPWNFPCYCNTFAPRVFNSCWMSSGIYLTTLQTSLLPVFATRGCGFHRHTADAIYQNALLLNELYVLIINFQEHLNTVENWPQKWKIKVNETKSSYVTFTLRKDNCPAISISQTVLAQIESVKYLGLHFNCKLTWKKHIAKKKKQTDLKAKEINWLIGRNSNLSLGKQIASLQSSDQTHLDIRNRTVGMRQQIQCRNHTEITIQNPQNHSKCPPVCIKSHTPYRPQHPLCKRGHQWKN